MGSGQVLENEIYPTGTGRVIKMPFHLDGRWNDECEDKIIHDGESFILTLAPKYLDFHVMQPEEVFGHDFLKSEWNEEVRETMDNDMMPRHVAKIRALRKRYPLKVVVEAGVLYSPTKSIILEDFGKIKTIMQQKIVAEKVFSNFKQRPTVQKTMEAAKVAAGDGMFDEEIMDDDMDLRVHTQSKPITRIPTPISSQPGSSKDCMMDLDFDDRILGTKKKTAKRMSTDAVRTVGTKKRTCPEEHKFDAMMRKLEEVCDFFNDELFELFQVPFDKAAKNIPDVKPNPTSLVYSYSQFHKRDLEETNTLKCGNYLFSNQNFLNILLYKRKNFFTGHSVPMSVRECPKVLRSLVNQMVEGLHKLAIKRQEEGKAAAAKNKDDDDEREDLLLDVSTKFSERLERLNRHTD